MNNKNNFKFRIDELDFNTGNLKVKNSLHPDFWVKYGLKGVIRSRLIEISETLIHNIDSIAKIEDIRLTGSMASCNWHALSDIDLHIVLDFQKIDENSELVRDLLNTKRLQWNKRHNITIYGHEVEIYFEDIRDAHQSAGIFSILHNEWVKKPRKESVEIDYDGSTSKAEKIASEIDLVYSLHSKEQYEEAYMLAKKLKNKIRKLRQAGLSREGIYSVENLAFKLLRNSDFLQRLSILKDLSYDKMYSLEKGAEIGVNIVENTKNTVTKWKNYLQN